MLFQDHFETTLEEDKNMGTPFQLNEFAPTQLNSKRPLWGILSKDPQEVSILLERI